MSDLNAWADIHARTIGDATVLPGNDNPFVTVKLPDAAVRATAIASDGTTARMEMTRDATLYLSIEAARELAHALLAATEPAASEAA